MIRNTAIIILFLIASLPSFASTTLQQDNISYPETAIIQMKQKILNIRADAVIQTENDSLKDKVPDVSISIGIKNVLDPGTGTMQHEKLLETRDEIKKAKEHLDNIKEAYENIKNDLIKGLGTEQELSKAEEELSEAKRNLKALEDKYRVYSNNGLQIFAQLRNGLLKLLN